MPQRLPKTKVRPEARIARDCDSYLRARGWRVKGTHGNVYQKGFPDRYVFHREYGQRWIDYKQPVRNSLTAAQQKEWPEWDAHGVGIWIMTAATDAEYKKLFETPNWRAFWRARYGPQDIDVLLAALAAGEECEHGDGQ